MSRARLHAAVAVACIVACVVACVGACSDRPSAPAPSPMRTTMPAASPVVTARAGALELAASATGTIAHVVLRNRGERALTVYAAAEGAGGHPRHHDFLRAELRTTAGARVLRLAGDRNSSTTGLHELAPGGETADDVDVAAWAADPGNGATPLAAGEHELTLVYEVAAQAGVWNGTLRAGPLVIRVP